MKLLRWIAIYAAGLVSGAALVMGAMALRVRGGGAPGGEVLVPLVLGMLIYIGYTLRQTVEAGGGGNHEE